VAGGEGGSYYNNVRKSRHLALTIDSCMMNWKEHRRTTLTSGSRDWGK
jgi:hypothetical protein